MEKPVENAGPTLDFSTYIPDIKSKDIDVTKIPIDSFRLMKQQFSTETDTKIAQFLIARSYNVEKASELLKANQKWRSETFPLNKATFANEMAKGKAYFIGYDKQGHPVLMYISRQHNPKERDPQEVANLFWFWAEFLISKLPPDRSKIVLLVNRVGSGFNNFDQEFMKQFAKVGQDNYPELLCQAIVAPSNIIFQTIWVIAKLFIDPETQSKVKLCMFQSGVFEWIDPQYIPVEMVSSSSSIFIRMAVSQTINFHLILILCFLLGWNFYLCI